MARPKFTVEICGYADEQTGRSKVFITADNKSDVHGIDDEWDTGSTLWDMTAKKLYMLNSLGVWVEQ